MALLAVDAKLNADLESAGNGYPKSQGIGRNIESYPLKIFQSSLNQLAHILIGITVGIVVIFTFQGGLPLGPTQHHIILCVIGYQLLMAQAILTLCPNNGWSNSLRLVDKRRAHVVLQIFGSAFVITGSIIKALDKTVNWNTYHGHFALVAMVFTTVSLVNGLSSLFAYEFRKCLPGNLSKITHICFGIVAFCASCIALCYGFDKTRFKNWSSAPIAHTLMGFTACFTFIIIINPAVTFFNKTVKVIQQ